MDAWASFRVMLPLAAILVACSCGRKSGPAPTASEIFHLRSECAALADKIRTRHPEGDLQQTMSHYDPKSNRCYVELSDVVLGDLVHTLYDGQTGQLLASTMKSLQEGSTFKSGEVSAGLKALPADTEARYKAAEDFIEKMMADDRGR